MYRGFADAKLLCCCPDGCLIFQDVDSQSAGPCFHEVLQSQHSLHMVLENPMHAGGRLFNQTDIVHPYHQQASVPATDRVYLPFSVLIFRRPGPESAVRQSIPRSPPVSHRQCPDRLALSPDPADPPSSHIPLSGLCGLPRPSSGFR